MSTVATVICSVSSTSAVEALQEGVGHHLRRASAVLQQVTGDATSCNDIPSLLESTCCVDGEICAGTLVRPSPAWPWPMSRRMRPPLAGRAARLDLFAAGPVRNPPGLLDAESTGAHPR